MQDWLEISLRTFSAVVILFLITKVLGKRQLSQLSLFEYITGITIGNIAGYISLDMDNNWYLGIVSLIVWISVSVGLEFWTLKNKKLRDVVDGRGTVLIEKGNLIKANMHKERITLDELLEQLRKKDVYRVADVEFAIMEQSGEINMLLKKEHQPLTPDMLGWKVPEEQQPQTVLMDGEVLVESLSASGKDLQWLKHELSKQHINIENVFLAQIDTNGELTVQTGELSLKKKSASKTKAQIADLLKQYEGKLQLLEQFAPNEDDKFDYRAAREKLKAVMQPQQQPNN
ncbi:MAG: DUF421 domain-containing protein [Candidatus Pristimantibacillus sp.]